MMTAAHTSGFAETLPPLRGRIQADAPLAPFTWFRAGGRAEVLVRPADADDLASFLRELPHEVPVQVIGACSNLIVRDGGLPGATIRLARGFSAIVPDAEWDRCWGRRAGCHGRGTCRCRWAHGFGIFVRDSRVDRRCGGDECRCLRRRDGGCPGLGRGRYTHG